MLPEIHGYEHIDYNSLKESEIKDHLERCKDFLWEEFNRKARYFFSPWGANSKKLQDATTECGLKLIDTSNIIYPATFLGLIKKNGPVFDQDVELFMHWWERGLRLGRIVGIYKYGSYKNALEQDDKAVWE